MSWTCLGHGQLECEVCNTHGQLKLYIKLIVTWTTHKNDHVVNCTALPVNCCGLAWYWIYGNMPFNSFDMQTLFEQLDKILSPAAW